MPSTIKFKTYLAPAKKSHSTSSPGATNKAALVRKPTLDAGIKDKQSKAKQAAARKSKFYNIIIKGKMKNIKPY
jgi:hypothetical protein